MRIMLGAMLIVGAVVGGCGKKAPKLTGLISKIEIYAPAVFVERRSRKYMDAPNGFTPTEFTEHTWELTTDDPAQKLLDFYQWMRMRGSETESADERGTYFEYGYISAELIKYGPTLQVKVRTYRDQENGKTVFCIIEPAPTGSPGR